MHLALEPEASMQEVWLTQGYHAEEVKGRRYGDSPSEAQPPTIFANVADM